MLTQISPFKVVEDSRKFVLFSAKNREGGWIYCLRSGLGKTGKESHMDIKYAFLQEVADMGVIIQSLGGALMLVVPERKIISLTGSSHDLGPIRSRHLVVEMFKENFPDHTIIDHLE